MLLENHWFVRELRQILHEKNMSMEELSRRSKVPIRTIWGFMGRGAVPNFRTIEKILPVLDYELELVPTKQKDTSHD